MYEITRRAPPPEQEQAGGYEVTRARPEGNSYGVNLGRQALQGLTLGFADEIEAGAKSALSFTQRDGYRYDEELQRIRGENEAFSAENPVVSTVAQIGGGLVLPGGFAAGAARQGLTAARAVRQGAQLGAGFGAVAGFGAGEGGVGNRLGNSAVGGVVGGVVGGGVGGAAYALGRGAQSAVRAVEDARAPRDAAARKIAREFERSGLNAGQMRSEIVPLSARQHATPAIYSDVVQRLDAGESAAQIARNLVNPRTGQNFSPSTVQSLARAYRQQNASPVNLIDLAQMHSPGSGRSVVELARTAANIPGAGQDLAFEALTTRQMGAGGRLQGAVDRAFGSNRPMSELVDTLQTRMQTEGAQAYQRAFANAQPFRLDTVLRRYNAQLANHQSALYREARGAIDEFYKQIQVGNTRAYMPPGAGNQPPAQALQRFMDARQALDDRIARSFADGRPTPLTRMLTQFRQEISDVVGQSNPEWRNANALYGELRRTERYMEEGREAASRLGSNQEGFLRQYRRAATPGQPAQVSAPQEAMRLGVAQKLRDMIGNAGRNPANTLDKNGIRQLLGGLFSDSAPDRRALDQLTNVLEREVVKGRTYNELLTGSRTAPMLARMQEFGENADLAGNLATGNVLGAARQLAARIARGLNERKAEEVIELLTRENPAQVVRALDVIIEQIPRLQREDALIGGMAAGLGGSAGAYTANNRR